MSFSASLGHSFVAGIYTMLSLFLTENAPPLDAKKSDTQVKPLIVIADDDPSDRLLLKLAIEEQGLDVDIEEYDDGYQTIEFAKSRCSTTTPMVLILDINMPKRNGIEVLEFLNENPGLCKVPVIMFSTSTNPADAEKTLNLGAKKYFVKPNDYSGYIELVDYLKEFLKEL